MSVLCHTGGADSGHSWLTIFRLHILYGKENYSVSRVVFIFSDTFWQFRILTSKSEFVQHLCFFLNKICQLHDKQNCWLQTVFFCFAKLYKIWRRMPLVSKFFLKKLFFSQKFRIFVHKSGRFIIFVVLRQI